MTQRRHLLLSKRPLENKHFMLLRHVLGFPIIPVRDFIAGSFASDQSLMPCFKDLIIQHSKYNVKKQVLVLIQKITTGLERLVPA